MGYNLKYCKLKHEKSWIFRINFEILIENAGINEKKVEIFMKNRINGMLRQVELGMTRVD
jgi:hypothetical protein